MFDTPVDKELQDGLKMQAKLAAFAIQDMLGKTHERELFEEELKNVMDAVYTTLFTSHYCKESESAKQFMGRYAQLIAEHECEPELLSEFEAE